MTEKPERDDFLPKLRSALNGFSPTPVCWAVLSAGKEMDEQLGHLTDWVNWLVDRYALDHRTAPVLGPTRSSPRRTLRPTHSVDHRPLR